MKKHLKTGASAVVLSLVVAGPAFAFDDVDWSWTSSVTEAIDIDISIDAANSFYPTGTTKAEQLQISGGNMSTYSNQNGTQFNVNNGGGGGPVVVDLGKLVVTDTVKIGHPDSYALDDSGSIVDASMTTNVVGIPFGVKTTHTIDLGEISVVVPPGGNTNLDALYDLGRLEGNSTAAANVANINSEVATTFHDGQIAFGGYDQIDSLENVLQALGAGVATALALPTGNRNLDAVASAAIAAQFGLIEQGRIDATATATNVLNAQVALNATGAGNLHSVTVGPRYAPVGTGTGPTNVWTDNIVIGDLNQFSLMNVNATADASGLKINGYKNLGKLEDQYGNWVAASSVNASAFGNVSSITNRVNGLSPLPHTLK